MNNSKLHHAYWYLSHFAKKIGSWGLIGLCLTIASMLFYVSKVPEIEAITEEARATKEELIAKSNNNKIFDVAESTPQTSFDEINRFYSTFPKAVALPQVLAMINRIANKQKLALNSGDYKFNKVKETNTVNKKKITKYEIVLPIKGQYLQIRTFIAEVLQQSPALALMDMQIRRENSLNQSVDAKLVFVIFVLGES